MHSTLDMLVHGRAEVAEYYRLAAARWQEIWEMEKAGKMETLARVLSREQRWFEEHCGGERIGQEIMVVSGFAGLFSTDPEMGFLNNRERAHLLFDAIRISACSSNVRFIAQKVVQFYRLYETSLV